jgi:hypothetical protein
MTAIKAILMAECEAWLDMANRLDGWATESRSGGWSTHQVKPNMESADYCRRHAAILRGEAQRLEAE